MNWNSEKYQALVSAFLALQTPSEVQSFLRDLMTEKELEELAGRLKVAIMLTNRMPYTEIVSNTGLSSTTVARVSKWLQSQSGGYRSVIQRLSTSHTQPARAR